MGVRERTVGRSRAAALPLADGERRSLLWTGLLLGVGVAGFVDETVFHQLLQWHNLYWATDEHGRILSDGVFHAVTTLLLLWGAARLWRAPHGRTGKRGRAVVGALLIGAGGFNAYDGIVQHVILHLHLVDEHVCPTLDPNNSILSCPRDIPLEAIWIAVGLAVAAAGVALWRQAAARESG